MMWLIEHIVFSVVGFCLLLGGWAGWLIFRQRREEKAWRKRQASGQP